MPWHLDWRSSGCSGSPAAHELPLALAVIPAAAGPALAAALDRIPRLYGACSTATRMRITHPRAKRPSSSGRIGRCRRSSASCAAAAGSCAGSSTGAWCRCWCRPGIGSTRRGAALAGPGVHRTFDLPSPPALRPGARPPPGQLPYRDHGLADAGLHRPGAGARVRRRPSGRAPRGSRGCGRADRPDDASPRA